MRSEAAAQVLSCRQAVADPMYGLLQPNFLGWKVDQNPIGVHTCPIQLQLASTLQRTSFRSR
jgi:hypothetical protein